MKLEQIKNLAEKIVQEWELRENGQFDLAFKVRPTCFSDGVHHDEVLVAKAFLELLQKFSEIGDHSDL